ncbi:MAG TPA: hypothetical protein VMB84_05840 [Stellaceae bacterium]|nr:hypothetical protein [Stellaceae bacterium]
MRYPLPLLALVPIAVAVVACTPDQSVATRIGDRTYRIISPEVPGGAEAPNRRLADHLCPGGYRKLEEESHKGGPDRVDWYEHNVTTVWTIKCI